MTQSIRKFISTTLMVSTTLAMTGLGLVGNVQAAGQTSLASVTLSNSTQNATGVKYEINFKPATTTGLHAVKFEFKQTASGVSSPPTNFSNSAATINEVSIGGVVGTSGWVLNKNVDGTLLFTTTSVTADLTGLPTLKFITNNISNNTTAASPTCDNKTDSETCWVRITTYSDGDANTTPAAIVDQGTTTWTVINPITVSATVDPILTFTVAGVSSGVTADTYAGATSVTTTSTTIPFGNITLGTSKVASQSLSVLTNANNGYSVYSKFNGTTPTSDLMIGTYAANNIDPFVPTAGTGGVGTTGWDSLTTNDRPGVWSVATLPNGPTGTTKNSDTGWLGERTNNANVIAKGFAINDTYAAPYVGTTSNGPVVMSSTGPDNGATPTYVSFKIQANAYQPSDTYSGITTYNIVASY